MVIHLMGECEFIFLSVPKGDSLDDQVRDREAERARLEQRIKVENHWRLPWADFEVMLGVKNSLQLRSLNLGGQARAESYLKACGFDCTKDSDKKVFEQFYCESIFIIRHVLMTFEERNRFPVPLRLLHLSHPRFLFMLASDRNPRRRYQRLWAVTIIKVFFAITNLEYSDKLRDIDFARNQIFGRIRSLIRQDSDGTQIIGTEGIEVKLHAIDWKEAKTRQSIILKQLHKPDSAADELFDYLGVRFVVKNESDLPLLLKILVDRDVLVPNNVLAGRTRNSLFNFRKAKQLFEILYSLSSMDRLEPEEMVSFFRKVPWTFGVQDERPRAQNAFTSAEYRSLQLTVRHLVRVPNPAHRVVDSLMSQLRHYRGVDSEDAAVVDLVPAETAKYFPIEIQLMDASAYDLSRFGAASHEQYKAAQLKVVRDRVLGSLMHFSSDKLTTQEY